LKVLQVHTRYRQRGGEDTIAQEEAALLRRHGHEVVEHHAENPEDTVGAALALARSTWNRAAARAVKAAVRRTRPDVAHVYNTWFAMSPAVFPAIKSLGVPTVMTVQNYRLMCTNSALFRDGAPCEDCVGTHPFRGVLHRCYRGSALASAVVATNITAHRLRGTWDRDVDVFLAPTPFARGRFLAAGLPPRRVVVKPNFVEDPGARPLPPSASTEVLYCGRLTAEKGVLSLLDAWESAAPPGLELVIAGDGPLRPALEQRTPAGLRLLGQVPAGEIRRRMLSARALAFPSLWYEGQPLVILEALASGLPVLTSDLGGMQDVAEALGGLWRLPPGDRAAWTAALRSLTDATVDEGGQRARTLYEQRFATGPALQALEAVYEAAISGEEDVAAHSASS
jgi:glycosyltransferase involved in cell wall biosynthesis